MIKTVDGVDSNLTERWKNVRLDARQSAFYHSTARINVCHSGRRSFKTECSTRRLITRFFMHEKYSDAHFWAGAPTQQQAKRIFWKRIKYYMPEWAYMKSPIRSRSESELIIHGYNGATLTVVGLDEPARIEGNDWDGGVIDELDNCKPKVFQEHVRPMMMRGGYIDLIGVPEGKLALYQLKQQIELGEIPNAAVFHWPTEEVLHLWLGDEAAALEIKEAKSTLDDRSYRQEYRGEFMSLEGRAYYTFIREVHAKRPLPYKKDRPLIFCFDFNKNPGTAIILQEQDWERVPDARFSSRLCCALDEVWITGSSNTLEVCTRLRQKLRRFKHTGDIYIYGDATGGAGGSAKVAGSDWDLIEESFENLGDRVKYRYRSRNPKPRIRVNALNARFQTADGMIHMLVDPKRCPHLCDDLENVVWNHDGTDLDKRKGELTHCTDGTGYWAHAEYPVGFIRDVQESVI